MSNNGRSNGGGQPDTGNSNQGATGIDFFASQDVLSDPENLLQARQDIAAARAGSATTSVVEYRSGEHCLVVAADAGEAALDHALAVAVRLNALKITVLCPLDDDRDKGETVGIGKQATESGIKIFYSQLDSISGYLGNFTVRVNAEAGESESTELLAELAITERGVFDLVLDLRTDNLSSEKRGAISGGSGTATADNVALSPFGYFRATTEAELDSAISTLPQLVGEFEKPKYFKYDSTICAQSRSEIAGCSNCIDVCATGAITAAGEGVTVDPYLCQGCGHCSTVCPSGAMTYAYPSTAEAILQTREMMSLPESRPNVLLLHAVDDSLEEGEGAAANDILGNFERSLPAHVLPLSVEEPGAFGIDYWATMIAAGIQQIVVMLEPVGAPDNSVPEARLRGGDGDAALRKQAELLGHMLGGLGLPKDMVRVVDSRFDDDFENQLQSSSALADWPGASFATHNDKRQTLRMAMDHLAEHLQPAEESVVLPVGSPFGQLEIKKDNCTLCMACVTTCPAGAILDGHSVPQLKFVEANCVQCGLCEAACPEDALGLLPRYLYNSIDARQQRILNEEEPFHCIRCHKGFATRKMIENMTGKLAGHWMFKDEKAVHRLKMCEDCRVKDMFEESSEGIQVHKTKTETDKPI